MGYRSQCPIGTVKEGRWPGCYGSMGEDHSARRAEGAPLRRGQNGFGSRFGVYDVLLRRSRVLAALKVVMVSAAVLVMCVFTLGAAACVDARAVATASPIASAVPPAGTSLEVRDQVAELEERISALEAMALDLSTGGSSLSAVVCAYVEEQHPDLGSYKGDQLQAMDWEDVMERFPDLSLHIALHQQPGFTGDFWNWVRSQCYGLDTPWEY